MNKISYLPAILARSGSWRGHLVRVLLANGMPKHLVQNAGQGQKSVAVAEKPKPIAELVIGEKTLNEKIIRPLLSAINTFRADFKQGERIQDVFRTQPAHTPKTQKRKSTPEGTSQNILMAGVADGRLLQAMLPLLLISTGRRIGQLAVLHGSDIKFKHGQWVAEIPHQRMSTVGLQINKDKTADAEEPFILHDGLAKIGFIDFVKSQGEGAVFKSLFTPGIKSPESTAQKRITKLIDQVEKEVVAHQFRHSYIKAIEQVENIPEKFHTLQTGHAATSVRGKYAREWDVKNAARVANLDLSDYVDWSIYEDFDFEFAAKKCVGFAVRQNRRLTPKGQKVF